MKKIFNIPIFITSLLIIHSCTDLDVEVFSEFDESSFGQTDAQIDALIANAYVPLDRYFEAYVILGDAISDVSTVPIRSNGGWDDGGKWPRMMRHEFPEDQDLVDRIWNMSFRGAASCNRLIEFFSPGGAGEGKVGNSAIADLRGLRAFYLWMALDAYGNIPVELRFAEADPQPIPKTPAEAFEIIESELLEAIPDMTAEKNEATYAKMNRWTAYMVLAKLYINAEKYGAGPHYAEASDAVDQIINSGLYDLESGYFANFRVDNTGSIENILVVPYERSFVNGFAFSHHALHQSAAPTFGFADRPWGGFSVQEDFYNAYDANDKRRGMFIVGQQYTIEAEPTWSDTDGFFYNNPQDQYRLVDCIEDFHEFSPGERAQLGWPVDSEGDNLDPACNIFIEPTYTFTSAEAGVRDNITPYRHGARFGKYEIELNTIPDPNNDLVIFRYGEALLIKAEALWRQNNGSAEALMLINQIRDRAGLGDLAALTEDDLYWEFKKEMALEGQGREITIRFGHWEDEWMLKTDNDPRKRWLPIPQAQRLANPNLVQVDYL